MSHVFFFWFFCLEHFFSFCSFSKHLLNPHLRYHFFSQTSWKLPQKNVPTSYLSRTMIMIQLNIYDLNFPHVNFSAPAWGVWNLGTPSYTASWIVRMSYKLLRVVSELYTNVMHFCRYFSFLSLILLIMYIVSILEDIPYNCLHFNLLLL